MSLLKWASVSALLLSLVGCASVGPAVPVRRTYTVVAVSDSGAVESEDEMDPTIPGFDPLHGAGIADQILSRFRGVDRKGPKTTIAQATRETFTSLSALVATLEADDDMRSHDPEVKRNTNVRVDEERRNVRVPAWIYAIKYEADQDWHVILGSSPSGTSHVYFNAEVSGLPSNGAAAHATLKKVRQQLAAMFEDSLPGGGGYWTYDEPVPVLVDGSLFYDIDHAAGVVGPTGMRPDTSWEIHPITNLKLR